MNTDIIDIDFNSTFKLISLKDLKKFCKSYKIKIYKKIYHQNEPMYIHKTLYELCRDVKQFEIKHSIKNGLFGD